MCDVLGIRNPSDVKRNLNEADKGLGSIYTPGGKQQVTVVNESPSGVSLVLGSGEPVWENPR